MTRVPKDILQRIGYFHDEVENLFHRLFQDELQPSGLADTPTQVHIDVIETADEVLVRADLPGVPKDEIELYGAPNFLVIRGCKPAGPKQWSYLRMERGFGPFQRLVVLPAATDPARVRARHEHGVLEVSLPKVVDRRRVHRQIPIE